MERLTHKARYEAGYKLNKGVKEWQASDRLGAYENTGLTPEQIMELKERDTARAPEPAPLGMDGMVCMACGKRLCLGIDSVESVDRDFGRMNDVKTSANVQRATI